MKRFLNSMFYLFLLCFSFSAFGANFSVSNITLDEFTKAKAAKLAPRGSATLTSSGELSKKGITHIVHAAYGSMTRNSKTYAPSISALKLSLTNSIRLAIDNKFKTIAIPFLGSGIFLERMNVSKNDLASNILSILYQHSSQISIVLVAYGKYDFELFKSLNKDKKIKIVNGSIIDFSVHNSKVIVNAANTELIFGGGLSGVIGKATHKIREINKANQDIISEIYR